jgi:hypothetical protein
MTFSRFLTVAAVALLFATTGCVEVTFPEPMPAGKKDLTEFPSAWQGTWTSHVNGAEAAGEDEIMVVLTDRVKGDPRSEDLVLGQNCTLRKLGRRLVLSLPQEEGGRYTALVAERQGETLVLRSFDPAADGAIDGWEELLGHDRVVKIHKKDNPTKKLKEVQLNPKNRCQFRKLVKHGTTELVTYTKVADGAAP